MPARTLSMRKIREIFRLLWECKLSQRQVATCCGISKTAVAECAARARHSRVSAQDILILSSRKCRDTYRGHTFRLSLAST